AAWRPADPGAAGGAAQDRGRAGGGGPRASRRRAHQRRRAYAVFRAVPGRIAPHPALSPEGRGGCAVIFTPVRELAALVRSRKVSPVELAEQFLERLERLGSQYNAVVTVMREHALGQARRAEGEIEAGRCRGPAHGLP